MADQDDLSLLDPEQHWLAWMGDDPRAAFREELELLFQKQTPAAILSKLVITEAPQFLTGGVKTDKPSEIMVVRAGAAIKFEATVELEDEVFVVNGAFSWACNGLNEIRRDRFWLDIEQDAEQSYELLQERIYFDLTDDDSAEASVTE